MTTSTPTTGGNAADFHDACVTLEHVRLALEWAERGGGRLDGTSRKYQQCVWDCGTACCVWGAARLIAGLSEHPNEFDNCPSEEWRCQSDLHIRLFDAMNDRRAKVALPAIRDALGLPEVTP